MADGANTFRVQAGENGVRLTPRQILQTRCCILVISCRSEQWSKQSPWNTPSKTGAYISNIWEWRWAHSSTLKMSLQPAEMRTEMSHAVILHIVLVRDLSIFCTHTLFVWFLYFISYKLSTGGVASVLIRYKGNGRRLGPSITVKGCGFGACQSNWRSFEGAFVHDGHYEWGTASASQARWGRCGLCVVLLKKAWPL